MVENFYLCTAECQIKLDEILDLVPLSWEINKEEVKNKITQNLFAPAWNANCVNTFKEFVQSFIIN